MFEIGWTADYPDPHNFLDILFHSRSSANHMGYHNPQVDKLLEQARVEREEDRRVELYHRAEQMILDDAPWVPLWHGGEAYVLVKPSVRGYLLTPMVIPKYRRVSIAE